MLHELLTVYKFNVDCCISYLIFLKPAAEKACCRNCDTSEEGIMNTFMILKFFLHSTPAVPLN